MNVIVVGAGVIGLSIADELARRGASVRVVDPRGPGLGATQASAGILAPRIEARTNPLLKLGTCSLSRYRAFVERLEADTQLSVEYHARGTLQVACEDDHVQALGAFARELAEAGVPHTLTIGGSASEVEPGLSTTVRAALEIPEHGHVGVATLLRALEGSLRRRGVALLRDDIQSVEPRGAHLAAVGVEHTLEGDAVVIAAGAWSRAVRPAVGASAPVRPVRGQLLHLALPSRVISKVIWGSDCYLVPWNDGSVLVGATVEDVGFDERATVEGVRGLIDCGRSLLPALAEASIVGVRVGLRPATADELPLIGPSATMRGVFYATGHYRSGVLLAPVTAALLADLLLDRRAAPELADVSPARLGL